MLPVFGKKAVLEWCVKKDLIESSYARPKCEKGSVNVLNSCELSINTPVFSPAPISSTCEPSKNSRIVDVISCISDVNPVAQILLFTALIQIPQCVNYLGDISLADPAFYKSGLIDVLLGVDLTLPLLSDQTLSLGKDKPFAIRSELGWIIGGKANSSGQNSFHVNHIQLVSNQLIKFWELDSVPCAKLLTLLE
ncbi:DUF1758 domain-containing protein [Trichonephila clavipes]|nr:DUF1758 domain-containing protein [Trichonephila clavipes]